MMGRVERRQIEYFIAVVEYGGFGRAAAEMHVTQSALSQAIAQLERELGTQLFKRRPRGVLLTPSGAAAVAPARQALRDLSAIRLAVSDVIGLAGGSVDIASLPTLAQWPVSPLVARFRQQYPLVKINIRGPDATRVPEVAEMVRDGQCEIGFGEEPGELEGLVSHVLERQDFVAVMPRGFSLREPGKASWDEILEGGLVVGPWWETSRPHMALRERYGRDLRDAIAVRTEHREAYLPLVVSGAGAAILPRFSGALAAASGALVAEIDPPISRSVVLIHPPGELSPAAHVFREIAVSDTA